MLTLRKRRIRLKSLAFSPDGGRIAAGGENGAALVWDLAARRPEHDVGVAGGVPDDVAFLSDTALAVSGVAARTLDLTSGLPGGWPHVRAARLAVAPGRQRLAAASGLRVNLWPLPDAREFVWSGPDLRSGVSAVAWSGDGRSLAAGLRCGSVALLDPADGRVRETLGGSGRWPVTALALSPDGAGVAWCAGTRLFARRGGVESFHSLGRNHFLGVAWHPSGGFYATSSGDGTVDYWDAATGERRESFGWGVGKLQGVAFDASGDRAACCSAKGHIVVWDVDR